MPTYLCHGFRWYRKEIRPFVLLNNLEDAAPDWIIGRTTSEVILKRIHKLFDFIPRPEDIELSGRESQQSSDQEAARLPPPRVPPEEDRVLAHSWSAVKLLEEYDPEEMREHSRPYAFVADVAVRVDLHLDIGDTIAKHSKLCTQKDMSWFPKLRDNLQKGEHISWYIVVCGGDEDRPSVRPDDTTGAGAVDEPQGSEHGRKDKSKAQAEKRSLGRKTSMGEGLRRMFQRKESAPGLPNPPPPPGGDEA